MSNQFQNPNVFLSSPNGFRTLRHHGPSSHQQQQQQHQGFSPSRQQFQQQGGQGLHGTLPRNFTHHSHHSLPSNHHQQMVTNGSLMTMQPNNNNNNNGMSMTHSTPLRPEWEASPVVRLPDWGSSSSEQQPRSFPADYGLPVSLSRNRPEVCAFFPLYFTL